MADTTTTTELAPLSDADRKRIDALLTAAQAVRSSVVDGSTERVKSTLDQVLLLAPALDGEYRKAAAAYRKKNGREMKAGAFLAHVQTIVGQLGTEKAPVTWPLSSDQTWAAKGYVHAPKAWASYKVFVANAGSEASWGDYATFADRYKLGHYDNAGKLTQKGIDYDQEQRDIAFAKATKDHKFDVFAELDWDAFLPEGATSEDWAVFWRQLRYEANRRVLKHDKTLTRTAAGKATLKAAKATFNSLVS